MAADKPGDIKYLTSFVKPDIGVLTSIGHSHLEAFGEVENIVTEKTELLKVTSGPAVLNFDDPKIREISNLGEIITFAIDQPAEITARNITTEIIDYSPLHQISNHHQKKSISLRNANFRPLI